MAKEGAAMTGVVGCTIGVNVWVALVWKFRTVLPVSTGSGYIVRTLILKKIDNYSVTGNFRTMLNIAALMDNKIRQINRVSNIPF